jgi:hypothetical protein
MWRDLNPVIAGAKRLIADPKLEIIVIETLGLASDYISTIARCMIGFSTMVSSQ